MYRGTIAFDDDEEVLQLLDKTIQAAAKAGWHSKLFFGNPCSKCGGCVRWKTSHTCYECKRRQERERQQRRKELKNKKETR